MAAKVFVLIPNHMTLEHFDLHTREARKKFPHFSRTQAQELEFFHVADRLRSPGHKVLGVLQARRQFPLRGMSARSGELLFLSFINNESWAKTFWAEQSRRGTR